MTNSPQKLPFRIPHRPSTVTIPSSGETIFLRYNSFRPHQALLTKGIWRPHANLSSTITFEKLCLIYSWASSFEFKTQTAKEELREMFDLDIQTSRIFNAAVSDSDWTYRSGNKKLFPNGVVDPNSDVVASKKFNHSLELIYGLEWMICYYLDMIIDPEVEDLTDELDFLAQSNMDEIEELYIEPVFQEISKRQKENVIWYQHFPWEAVGRELLAYQKTRFEQEQIRLKKLAEEERKGNRFAKWIPGR